MITDRKIAFDTISRVMAVTRLDIEQHQAINDLSLHIHAENFIRDVFNFVYDASFVNANQENANEPYIDLVDHNKKKVVQITTTRSKEKIKKSLKSLEKYKEYKIEIFYLLDKATPKESTVREVESEFPVKLDEVLKDYSDLLSDINALKEEQIVELANKHFVPNQGKYTEEIVLDLTFKKLIKELPSIRPAYDDDLGSVDADEKIVVNNINGRTRRKIYDGLDYSSIVGSLDDGELGVGLRALVVDGLYRDILVDQLKKVISKSEVIGEAVSELQKLAFDHGVDFNKLIHALSVKLEAKMVIVDFNSMKLPWVLIAYFFEICDVGVRDNDIAK